MAELKTQETNQSVKDFLETITPSQLIDKQIADADGWRGELIARLRHLVHEVDPEMQEEWKWDVGVYVHSGMVCAIAAFKDHVKINFFKGAQLTDTNKLFNSGLESKKNRSINFAQEDKIDEVALKSLIQEAVSLNK